VPSTTSSRKKDVTDEESIRVGISSSDSNPTISCGIGVTLLAFLLLSGHCMSAVWFSHSIIFPISNPRQMTKIEENGAKSTHYETT